MLDTGCQLISVFNEDMNATRKLTSVILTKGGLKKVAFKRLSPVYVSMGYGATNTLFESLLGKGLTKYSSTGKAKWTKEYRGSNLSCKDWRLLQGMMELRLSDKVLKDWKSQVEEGVQREQSILQRLETAAGEDGAESELVQQLNEQLDYHRTLA